MLIIRTMQLESLRLSRMEPYKLKVREALIDLITPKRLLVTDEQLDRVIEFGIRRAGRYGFSTEREVFNLIAAMVVFGPDFANGLLKGHFARSLDANSPRLSSFRADDLYEEVRYRLEQSPDFKVCDLQTADTVDEHNG